MPLMSNTTILANNSNETALDQQNLPCVFVASTAEKIATLLAYCFILLGSFFGNTFIIIIVYKCRHLRKTINYFIVNMAVSDLVYPVVVIPVQIIALSTDSWNWRVSGILGSIFCKLVYFSREASYLVSSQSLVWIAIDRFVAVVFPIKLGLISSKMRTIAIVSTWIFAAALNSPTLITEGLTVHGNNTFCDTVNTQSIFISQEAFVAYFWLQFAFFFIAPLSLITVLYTATAVALKRQSKALENACTAVQRHSFKKRKQAIAMVVVTVVLFYICVTPYALFSLAPYWKPSCAFQKIDIFLANILIYASSTVSPIICLSFVGSYRRGLRNILCPCSGIRSNKMAKREQVTLREIKNRPEENYGRTSKDTANYEETLDTVL
ncbi:Galanin receptor type 1 [Desmophyllum pertusum]|uniref:Galanin receptor type 1 n=1 Tax=Desmophyllum pertusum TaxID=174260 RepID=A0A9X0D5L7_9CNID|nr:Galanin receptor type 1 [Desmophyllum pertusum]